MLNTGCSCGPDGRGGPVCTLSSVRGPASIARRGVQLHPPSDDMLSITRGLPFGDGSPNPADIGSTLTSARSCHAANSLVCPLTTPAAMVGKASARARAGSPTSLVN